MAVSFRSQLTLPNEPEALPIARAYLTQIARLGGLEDEAAAALVGAAEEACANVIDHAYEPGEKADFTVTGELTPGDVVLSIRDRGMPIDAARALSPDASPARVSASGGLQMIYRSVDRAEWIGRGKEGKELRLVKHRPVRDITEHLPEDELQEVHPETPLAAEQEYEIRLLQSGDALGVSRCIYQVYGNSYFHEACYYPERLERLNEAGELVSIVSVGASDGVVGHYALERPQMVRVAERGMAVVSPAHRGRDLMGRMRILLEEEARRLGLVGVYSVAVTRHVYSQRVNEEFGSDVCGLILGGGPSSQVFKKIGPESLPERVSWVLYFTYVQPPELAVAHVPEHHRPVVEEIYRRLELPVEFREGAPAEGHGEVEVTFKRSFGTGTIRVHRVGEDSLAEIRRARHDLCDIAGAEAVYLELPLAQPGTPDLCRAAEGQGFFFSGVGPSFARDGDALLLQYLNVPLDTSLLHVANPFAKELVDYIERERQRVAR